MIVTLRTLPRDDGQTSVILTRVPSHPDDPEVLMVTESDREAINWILEQVPRLVLQAGEDFRSYDGRYHMTSDKSQAVVTLDLDLPAGSRVVCQEKVTPP